MTSNEEYFIGLYKTTPTINGVTYWLDGSTSTFREYALGEPNDDKSCFVIKTDKGPGFMDSDCSNARRYVCKLMPGIPLMYSDSDRCTTQWVQCWGVFE